MILLLLFLFLLLFISVAIGLLIKFIVAKKFEEIAFQKGYDNSIHSFAMCFWLGIVGYLYVLALPNLKICYNINDANFNDFNEKVNNTSSNVQGNDIYSNLRKEESPKEKYDKLIAKAERFKDPFFDRGYRIRIYESIVQDMEAFASEDFEDSAIKLIEYRTHLELLKSKKIK